MADDRLRCAERALRDVPEGYRTVEASDLVARERGRSVHRGMLVAWAWDVDAHGRPCLDLLTDHRHPGMSAARHLADGTSEPIPTPTGMRRVSSDPAEDAELQRQFAEENRRAHDGLVARGLLPDDR